METESWTVVQFLQDDNAEPVSSARMKGDSWHWPSLHQTRLTNTVKILEPLNTSCPTQMIKVFKNSTFDDYTKTRSKANTAEDTNDMQSENDSPKRNRKQKRTSTDNDESVDDFILPSPIRVKIENKTDSVEFASEDENSNEEVVRNTNATQHCIIGIEKANNNCQKCTERDRYLEIILEQNHLIRGMLTDVLREIKELKTTVKGKNGTPPKKKNFFKKYSALKFPLDTDEEFFILENILNNEEDFEDAIQELSKIGGSNNYQFVKRVFSSLMTDNVAIKYSWLGRKGKKDFHKLRISNLAICAAEKANMATSRHQTEVSIQQWLKRATDRMGATKKF